MRQYKLQGPIVPKARPRFGGTAAYLPKPYRNWKQGAIVALQSQHEGPPIDRASVEIVLSGKHPRRGDLDNLAGSILDALVQGRVLTDDRISVVSKLSIALEWGTGEPIVLISLDNVA